MQLLDKVRLIRDRERYRKDNVFAGEIGVIDTAEIRDNEFYVMFYINDPNSKMWYKWASVKIEDLELVEEFGVSDKDILEDLPGRNPNWWCKVKNGFIYNLKGEKKNKIAYDYDS